MHYRLLSLVVGCCETHIKHMRHEYLKKTNLNMLIPVKKNINSFKPRKTFVLNQKIKSFL